MRDGKDHMEIRRVNDLGPAPVHPDFLFERLAVGTIAVAAGVIVDLCMPAVRAYADVAAESLGFAAHEGISGLALDMGLAVAAAVMPVGKAENLLYGKLSQGIHPLTGQRD